MYSETFTSPGDVTSAIHVRRGGMFTVTMGAGFTGEIAVERTENFHAWTEVVSYTSAVAVDLPGDGAHYRLRAKTLSAGSSAVTIKNLAGVIRQVRNEEGKVMYAIDEDGVRLLGKGITAAGAGAVAQVCRSFGRTLEEALAIMVIDEEVDLTDANAKTINISQLIPSGAALFSITTVVQNTISAAGTSERIGIGDDTDPDKYILHKKVVDTQGKGGVLLNGTPLAADEQVTINACTLGGILGDSDITGGRLRLRIVYFQIRDLENVAAA